MNQEKFIKELRKLGEVETIRGGFLNTYNEGMIVSISYTKGLVCHVFSGGEDDFVLEMNDGRKESAACCNKLEGILDLVKATF